MDVGEGRIIHALHFTGGSLQFFHTGTEKIEDAGTLAAPLERGGKPVGWVLGHGMSGAYMKLGPRCVCSLPRLGGAEQPWDFGFFPTSRFPFRPVSDHMRGITRPHRRHLSLSPLLSVRRIGPVHVLQGELGTCSTRTRLAVDC